MGGNNSFDRLKIGIGPQPPLPSEVYVLQNFTQEQLDGLKPVLKNTADAVDLYFQEGLNAAQTKFN